MTKNEYTPAEQLLLSHRSIRRFQARPIDDDTLGRIVECGERAPNTGNMQIYSIVATRDEHNIAALSKLHFGQCASAPLFLTVCVDVNRYHHWCRLRGCDEPYSNFLWLFTGTVDASLATENMCVAAESLGLGACYLGTVLYNTRAIADFLQLPTGVVPVITVAMGYPDEQPAQSERLPIEGVLHHERYNNYSDDDINRVHRIREEFPFNQEMVRINNKENLAQVFTEIRYPRKDNEAISQALSEFCQQAGMMQTTANDI